MSPLQTLLFVDVYFCFLHVFVINVSNPSARQNEGASLALTLVGVFVMDSKLALLRKNFIKFFFFF